MATGYLRFTYQYYRLPKMSLIFWLFELGLAILLLVIEGLALILWTILPFRRIQQILSTRQKKKAVEIYDPRWEYNFLELVSCYGYEVEHHFVETQDGYLLGLFRIPPRNTGNANDKGPKGVVFFQHGFLTSCESFVARGPGKALPYTLVDAGYDVWFGNNRGNKYSYKHRHLSPNDDKFWDFCLDDLAKYDLPAMIEYVLARTGAKSLSYVGFSQGSAQGFAAFSINEELARKINIFIALAPATRIKHLKNQIAAAVATSRPQLIQLLFGKRILLKHTLFWRKLLTWTQYVTLLDWSMNFLFGWTAENIDHCEKTLLYSHLYSYGSVKTLIQWFQITRAQKFQMFDDNILAKGGQDSEYQPYVLPVYPVHQLKCPIALFLGGRDTVPDNDWLISQLCPQYVPEQIAPSSSQKHPEPKQTINTKSLFAHLHTGPSMSPFSSPSASPTPVPRKLKQPDFLRAQDQGNVGHSPHLSKGGSAFLTSSHERAMVPNRHHPSQHRLASSAVQKSSPICYVHLEDSYEHLDFMWASTAPERIFRRAFDLIRDHSHPENHSCGNPQFSISQS